MPSLYDSLADSAEDIRELASVWPLCFEFQLEPNSTIIVAGAYKGKVLELLSRMYPQSNIYGFEPQPWAWEHASLRTSEFNNVMLRQYAIGIETGTFPMGEWGTDGCSFVDTGPSSREHGEGEMVEFSKAMADLGIEKIDLAVFNMEGYEFVLLPYLLNNDWPQKIERLAVQWHINLGIGDYPNIHKQIEDWQVAGHKLIYDHRPQWTYTVKRNEQ